MSAPKRIDQDAFFRTREGDRYWQRNREALRAKRAEHDPPLRLIRAHGVTAASALELGCADGFRLELLRRELGCRAAGVDASEAAIEAGRVAYPGLELHTGTLAEVPIRDRVFDLVIVHFVLHWNARETLLRACGEVDRLLADGGHLILGDFLPERPERRVYHHAADGGVFTFKQDYARIFTASNLYSEVDRITFDATRGDAPPGTDVPPGDRGFCALLRKSLADGYPVSG